MGLHHVISVSLCFFVAVAAVCSHGGCKLLDKCSSDKDCADGLYCLSCSGGTGLRCVRSNATNQFKLVNNSLPFNKYAFLTTHNSFAYEREPSHAGLPRITVSNQQDSVTEQLNHGVRALMLDMYDFKGEVWLCHSFNGNCNDLTAFKPALTTLMEVEAFLSANPCEIVTLILEDYVKVLNGLTKLFIKSGLKTYWFPLSKMPKNGENWPLVKDMVANNERLLVFTSKKNKEPSEGIAYQWNYMVENQYGDGGLKQGSCRNRPESASLDDRTKSLVLVNHFSSTPTSSSCELNSAEQMIEMLGTCYGAAGNRWANFVAVNFYKLSDGGGAFHAVDMLNGKLLCGCKDVHACKPGSSLGASITP